MTDSSPAGRGPLPETCGDCALLADPADPDELADALVTAVCDDGVRRRLIDAGLRRAAAFPWSRTAALTDTVIGELLAEN